MDNHFTMQIYLIGTIYYVKRSRHWCIKRQKHHFCPAARRHYIKKTFDVSHSDSSLKDLSDFILNLDGETRVVMECTGRYHEPILHALHDAGIFVSAVNPHLIKNFGNNTIRKVKSDPADS